MFMNRQVEIHQNVPFIAWKLSESAFESRFLSAEHLTVRRKGM